MKSEGGEVALLGTDDSQEIAVVVADAVRLGQCLQGGVKASAAGMTGRVRWVEVRHYNCAKTDCRYMGPGPALGVCRLFSVAYADALYTTRGPQRVDSKGGDSVHE